MVVKVGTGARAVDIFEWRREIFKTCSKRDAIFGDHTCIRAHELRIDPIATRLYQVPVFRITQAKINEPLISFVSRSTRSALFAAWKLRANVTFYQFAIISFLFNNKRQLWAGNW
jgi:hypothetical protein